MVLGCHNHYLNIDCKLRLFNLRKYTEVLKEEIWSGLFSAAYQNGDQYYDVGSALPYCMRDYSLCLFVLLKVLVAVPSMPVVSFFLKRCHSNSSLTLVVCVTFTI